MFIRQIQFGVMLRVISSYACINGNYDSGRTKLGSGRKESLNMRGIDDINSKD